MRVGDGAAHSAILGEVERRLPESATTNGGGALGFPVARGGATCCNAGMDDVTGQTGERWRLTVDRLAFEGRGVARREGLVVFVDGALPGEEVEAEVVARKKNHAVAVARAILAPSPSRREPGCPVFGACGGCCFLDFAYEGQAAAKERFVAEAVRSLPGVADTLRPIVAAPEPFRFRNKMSFSVGRGPEGPVVGLHTRHDPNRVVSAASCLLPSAACGEVVRRIEERLRANRSLRLARVEVREARATGQRMVHLVDAPGGRRDPAADAAWAEVLRDACDTILASDETRGPATRGRGPGRLRTLHGPGYLVERAGPYEFRIGPHTFFQTNTAQAERLFAHLAARAKAGGARRIWDLYAGAGAISLFLAAAADEVVAVEGHGDSVREGVRNAAANGVKNVRFVAADVAHWRPSGEARPDLVAIDPPRAGLRPDVARAIAAASPARVFYVSCHPAALARDLAIFRAEGYECRALQPFDFFPQSFHVECVAELERG